MRRSGEMTLLLWITIIIIASCTNVYYLINYSKILIYTNHFAHLHAHTHARTHAHVHVHIIRYNPYI